MRTHVLLLAGLSACVFRFENHKDDGDDFVPERPDDSDVVVDTDDTDGDDTADTDDTDVAVTCPAPIPADATITGGRIKLSRGYDELDGALDVLACCSPLDLVVWQGLGSVTVNVTGEVEGSDPALCDFEVTVEIEQGWTTYACRKEIPVVAPPGLDDPLTGDAVATDGACAAIDSGGPQDGR